MPPPNAPNALLLAENARPLIHVTAVPQVTTCLELVAFAPAPLLNTLIPSTDPTPASHVEAIVLDVSTQYNA